MRVGTIIEQDKTPPVPEYTFDGTPLEYPAFDPKRTKKIDLKGGCNTPDEKILENVAINIRRRLPQVQPYEPNDNVCVLVCGGRSLLDTEDELRQLYWSGAKIVTINGAYDWCIKRNYKPSATFVLDARASNARFVETPIPGCRYLLGGQCHPDTFEICKDRDVLIWHACSAGDAEVELLKKYYFDRFFPITIGTTAGVRAISVMRMLGFQKFHIFGLDSCWIGNEHHAYEQPENQKDQRLPVWLRPEGRDDLAQRFECAPWHMKQFEDFQKLIKERGEMFQLNVHGPGLIASVLRTGATIHQTEE